MAADSVIGAIGNRRRGWGRPTGVRLLLAGLVVTTALLAAACSSGGGGASGGSTTLPEIDPKGDEAARLEAAQVRWAAAGIEDYRWTFRRICFCPPATADVRVEGGEADRSSIAIEFGHPEDLDFTTMEELYGFIADEIERSDEVTVDYDPVTGQVRSVEADRIATGVDDELGYDVLSFVPEDQHRPALAELELTESYPCGHGFQGSNAAQTIGLTADFVAPAGDPDPVVHLPDPAWEVTVVRGEHLFANWCNDLVPPGSPEPRVTASLPVVAGTIGFEGPVPGPDAHTDRFTGRLTDLVVEKPDGTRVTLPDATLVNDAWGGAAG